MSRREEHAQARGTRQFVCPHSVPRRAGTPSFFIIHPKGVIRHKWAGALGAKAIDTALEKLVQEAETGAKSSLN